MMHRREDERSSDPETELLHRYAIIELQSNSKAQSGAPRESQARDCVELAVIVGAWAGKAMVMFTA